MPSLPGLDRWLEPPGREPCDCDNCADMAMGDGDE